MHQVSIVSVELPVNRWINESEIERKKSSWWAGDPFKTRPATTPQCWLLPHDVSQMSPCHLDRAWEDVLLPFTETATCYETPNEETDDRTKAMSKTHTIYKDKTNTKQRGILQNALSKKYCNSRGKQIQSKRHNFFIYEERDAFLY